VTGEEAREPNDTRTQAAAAANAPPPPPSSQTGFNFGAPSVPPALEPPQRDPFSFDFGNGSANKEEDEGDFQFQNTYR